MAINNKGQGLPLSFIVIAAISALILILVIAFTIGGLGGFFKQITVAGGGEELSTVQTACQAACNKAQIVTSLPQFQTSEYCRKTYSIDLNKDGKLTSENPKETGLNCWTQVSVANQVTGPSTGCTVQIGETVYSVNAGSTQKCLNLKENSTSI